MYLPKGPCLRSLQSYPFQHIQKKILEIKKEQNKNRQKNKTEHVRQILSFMFVLLMKYYFFSDELSHRKHKTLYKKYTNKNYTKSLKSEQTRQN